MEKGGEKMRMKRILGIVNILLLLGYLRFVLVEKNNFSKSMLSIKEMKKVYGGYVWTGYKCYLAKPVQCGDYSDPCPPLDIGTECTRCSGAQSIHGCIPATCNDQCYWEIFICDSFIVGKCLFGTCRGEVDGPDCKTNDCNK